MGRGLFDERAPLPAAAYRPAPDIVWRIESLLSAGVGTRYEVDFIGEDRLTGARVLATVTAPLAQPVFVVHAFDEVLPRTLDEEGACDCGQIHVCRHRALLEQAQVSGLRSNADIRPVDFVVELLASRHALRLFAPRRWSVSLVGPYELYVLRPLRDPDTLAFVDQAGGRTLLGNGRCDCAAAHQPCLHLQLRRWLEDEHGALLARLERV